jgi:hypothetical protein
MAFKVWNSFGGGLVADSNNKEEVLEGNFLAGLVNASVRNGNVEVLAPFDTLVTLASDETCIGIIRDIYSEGFFVAVAKEAKALADLVYVSDTNTRSTLLADCYNPQSRVFMHIMNNKLFTCDGIRTPIIFKIDVPATRVNLTTSSTPSRPAFPSSWTANPPVYGGFHANRLWVITTGSNELWHSVLDDCADWTIASGSPPPATSANVFTVGEGSNLNVSIVTGLFGLVVFKEQGLYYIVNNGDLYDANDFSIKTGYTSITTQSAWTTCSLLDKILTVGKFGLQALSLNSVSGSVVVENLYRQGRDLISQGYIEKSKFQSIEVSQDFNTIFWDGYVSSLSGIINGFYGYKVDDEVLVDVAAIDKLQMLGSYYDKVIGNKRLLFRQGNKVFAWKGSQLYPEGTDSAAATTASFVLSRDQKVCKLTSLKVEGILPAGATLSYYIDDSTSPLETIEVPQNAESTGVYTPAYFNSTQPNTLGYFNSSGDFVFSSGDTLSKNRYATFRLFGNAEKIRIQVVLPDTREYAILKSLTLEYYPMGHFKNG